MNQSHFFYICIALNEKPDKCGNSNSTFRNTRIAQMAELVDASG